MDWKENMRIFRSCASARDSAGRQRSEKRNINRPKGYKNYNMKKIIILGIFVLNTIISFSQTQSSEHLEFKGVPIDGTLNEYVAKMKQNGFTHIGTEDGVAMLRGDFAGYKNCIIGVATLKQKDLVSKITVIFSDCDTWSSLSSNYFSLKEMLTEKYGKPSDVVEKFQSYSQPRDDKSKIYEVQFDRCKYYTTYETKRGRIQLSIEHNSVISCFVMLSYYDKINSDIVKAKAIDDL